MNIVLVNPVIPPARDTRPDRRTLIDAANEYMYPYSLVYLSSYLAKNGYDSKIMDLNMTSEQNLFKFLKVSKPDVVGVTGVTENRFRVLDLISNIRGLLKDTFIVVGGRQFSYTPLQTLNYAPEINTVVRGEGEVTFLDLIRHLDQRRSLDDIAGITYRHDNEIYTNPDRIHDVHIDDLAIDRKYLPEGGYSDLLLMRNYEKECIQSIPFQTGRGCTHACIFCVHRFMKYRMRTLDHVMDEIEFCIKKYSCRNFSFNDPSIYCNQDWMKDFCDELLRRKLDIKWYCEGRIDIDLDLLRLMARAGCKSLDVGIESGSPKVLKSIRKNIDPSMFIPYAKLAKELGIRSKLFFMISLPDEHREDALLTYKTAKNLGKYAHRLGCGFTHIFPGTTLEKMAIDRGVFPENFDWYDRSYSNNLPYKMGFRVSSPVYLEHLGPKFIKGMLDKYQFLNFKMAIINGDFVRLSKNAFNTRSSLIDFVGRGLKILKGAF